MATKPRKADWSDLPFASIDVKLSVAGGLWFYKLDTLPGLFLESPDQNFSLEKDDTRVLAVKISRTHSLLQRVWFQQADSELVFELVSLADDINSEEDFNSTWDNLQESKERQEQRIYLRKQLYRKLRSVGS